MKGDTIIIITVILVCAILLICQIEKAISALESIPKAYTEAGR